MRLAAQRLDSESPPALVRALASNQLTIFTLVIFALLIVAATAVGWPMTWPAAAPMLLLALNLAAAIVTRGAFRRQTALLVFHLALLLLLLLVAAGRLSQLRGTTEVTVGGEFSGLTMTDAGPLHFGRIDRVRFVNEGFVIDYLPGARRDTTRNRIRWRDEAGVERVEEIGDNRPLLVHGYRFHPTSNKGFAPLYVWLPKTGAALRGSVHLPAWPANGLRQSLDWTLPGTGISLWSRLEFSEDLLPADSPASFRPPREYELVMRRGEQRWTMRPGDRHVLPEGTLVFEGLTTWMGYQVFYDWTLPWLLAVSLVATASLFRHCWTRYFRQPW